MPTHSRNEDTPTEAFSPQRTELIQDLYIWGPALIQELKAKYSIPLLHELERNKVLARRKFIGFEVYLLSGAGLRPYGFSLRYNYVPSKNVVLGAIITRALARQYTQEGYRVQLYDGYTKRGRDNIILAYQGEDLTLVIGRASITMKSARLIVNALSETFPDIRLIHTVVIQEDYDQTLLNARSIGGIPFEFFQFPMTRFTRESFGPAKS